MTAAEAGRLLGVSGDRAKQWAASGRLTGRRLVSGLWVVDPASVQQQRERISRASWWRRDGLSPAQASDRRGRATTAVLQAAFAWADAPDDPSVVAALMAAVEVRRKLEVDGKPQSGAL